MTLAAAPVDGRGSITKNGNGSPPEWSVSIALTVVVPPLTFVVQPNFIAKSPFVQFARCQGPIVRGRLLTYLPQLHQLNGQSGVCQILPIHSMRPLSRLAHGIQPSVRPLRNRDAIPDGWAGVVAVALNGTSANAVVGVLVKLFRSSIPRPTSRWVRRAVITRIDRCEFALRANSVIAILPWTDRGTLVLAPDRGHLPQRP